MKKKKVLGFALLISLNSLKSFASLTPTSSNTPSSQEQPSVDKHGTTPLHMTSDNDHRKTIEMLIKAGMQQGATKKTTKKRKKRNELLLPKEVKTISITPSSLSLPFPSLFQTMSTPLYPKDLFCDWAPLHKAVWRNEQATVEQLLAARATIDILDKNHETPLHLAARQGNTAIVKLLLTARATIDLLNKSNQTPLHRAVLYNNNNEAIVEILLTAGAKTDIVDAYNNTPLYQVINNFCYKEIVAVLLTERAPLVETLRSQFHPTAIINLLLLMDLDSADWEGTFSLKTQDFLQQWKYDTSLFKSTLKISKELAKEQYEVLTNLLQNYKIPTVIVTLILEYHQCRDTRISLFKKAGSTL